jgi:hypothetical protein
MTTTNRYHPSDDEPAEVFYGLERLAQDLDARRYPGQAWVSGSRRRAPRSARKLIATLAVTASAVFLAAMVYHGANRQAGVEPVVDEPAQVAQAPAPAASQDFAEVTVPNVVVVEDSDSYSIIDLTTDVPLVSFATKDSYSPARVVPVLLEPSSQPPAVGKLTL